MVAGAFTVDSLGGAFIERVEGDPSTVVGMSEPSRIDATVALAEHPIPDELWDRILPLAALGRSGV